MNKLPIYLMGFMTSGKSKLGSKLAFDLGLEFIDLDDNIEQSSGQTVTQIFANEGEIAFRIKERAALKNTSTKEAVVALGGGTVCHFDNLDFVKSAGTSLYLKVAPQILIGRLKQNKKNRPLVSELSDEALSTFVYQKMSERAVYYEQAEYVLEDNNPSVSKVKQILGL